MKVDRRQFLFGSGSAGLLAAAGCAGYPFGGGVTDGRPRPRAIVVTAKPLGLSVIIR